MSGMRTGGRDDFQTKAALYDELFSRGWRESAVAITHYDRVPDEVRDAEAFLHQAAADLVGWAMAHPAYAQLMFWRPVPNWQPSPSACAPAVEMVERLSEGLGELQRRRLLRPDVDLTEATDAWTV